MAYFGNFKTIDYDFEGNGIMRKVKDLSQYSTILTKNIDNVAFYSFYNIRDGERPDSVSQKLYGTPEYYWTFLIVNADHQNTWHDWPKSSDDLRRYTEAEYVGLAGIFPASEDISGEFVVGGTVTGSLSGATGKIKAIFPTNGYIQFEKDEDSPDFRAAGETITMTAVNSDADDDIAKVGNSVGCSSIVKTAYAPAYHIDDGTKERTKRRTAGTSPVTHFEVESERNLELSKIKIIKPEFIGQVAADFAKAMRES